MELLRTRTITVSHCFVSRLNLYSELVKLVYSTSFPAHVTNNTPKSDHTYIQSKRFLKCRPLWILLCLKKKSHDSRAVYFLVRAENRNWQKFILFLLDLSMSTCCQSDMHINFLLPINPCVYCVISCSWSETHSHSCHFFAVVAAINFSEPRGQKPVWNRMTDGQHVAEAAACTWCFCVQVCVWLVSDSYMSL